MRDSKFFGSPAFRRLWFSQVLSSLGDWIGLIAIAAIAGRVSGTGGLGLVLAVRMGLAFLFAPFAGVLIDRWNRKYIMVFADIVRCVVLCILPFFDTLPGLVLASIVLELMTLLWSPAKEASVPNLVRPDFLPNANSLSLAAAYGTFPFASALFAVLATLPAWIGQSEHFARLHLSNEAPALYFDAFTYVASAAVITTLAIAHQPPRERDEDASRAKEGIREAMEGLKYVNGKPRVRAVILGMATGLIGGGMVVPLGQAFAVSVVHAGSGGYGLLLTAIGTGTAVGIISVSVLQKRLNKDRMFVLALMGAAVSLALASAMNGLGAAAFCIASLGLFAGAVYVLGFTSLQTDVVDEMRGRVFATFYTVTRLCLLGSLALTPLVLLPAFNAISSHIIGGSTSISGVEYPLPGVRLTLWLGAAILFLASLVAIRSLRRPVGVHISAAAQS